MSWYDRLVAWVKQNPRPEPEVIRTKRESQCSVDGCQITKPHSHTEALLKRIREEKKP